MKILILGGTGLLGQYAALEALNQNHEVMLVGRRENQELLSPLNELPFHALDVFRASEFELVELFTMHTHIILALGADDREIHEAPAQRYFQENLVDLTSKIMICAAQANIKGIVICGSYFTAWDRLHPEFKFKERHPYVMARYLQQETAFKIGTNMNVTFIEIPYVFGTVPNQNVMWKSWLFDRIKKMPIVFYPKGGSAIVTAKQVGQALVNALQLPKQHNALPIVDENMSWRQLLTIVMHQMKRRPFIVNAPKFLAQRTAKKMNKQIHKENKEAGIDPLHLMDDIMYRQIYFDPEESHQLLNFEKGGIREAIAESVRKAYEH